MKYYLIVFFNFLGLESQAIQAQTTAPTVTISSLDQVLATVIKKNPTQVIYQKQIKQASFSHKASKSFMFPTASFAFSGTNNLQLPVTPVPGVLLGHPENTYYLQFGKPYTYNIGLTLYQDIINWPAVLQARIAEKYILLNKVQQEAYSQYLTEQTAKLYYSALIAKSALKLLDTDQELADSLLITVRQKRQEGTSNLITINQVLIQINNIKQSQAQRQQLYDYSIENLKIILGETPSATLQLTEILDLYSFLQQNNLNACTDKMIDVYQQQVILSELQRQAQRSVTYPRIWLSAYLGIQQFRDNMGFSFSDKDWTGYRYVSLGIGLPLFAGFVNKNKYESAVLQKDIAEKQYTQARQQSDINDRLLQKTYNDYLEIAKTSADNFILYTKNLRLNQQRYKEGITSFEVYLKSFMDYLVAENTHLTNLSQLISAKAVLLSRSQ